MVLRKRLKKCFSCRVCEIGVDEDKNVGYKCDSWVNAWSKGKEQVELKKLLILCFLIMHSFHSTLKLVLFQQTCVVFSCYI